MFDLPASHAEGGWNWPLIIRRGALRDKSVVESHALSHLRQLVHVRHRNDVHRPHRAVLGRTQIVRRGIAVRSRAASLGIRNVQRAPVCAELERARPPTHRNVTQNMWLLAGDIDDGNRVDASLRHVQSALVRACGQRHGLNALEGWLGINRFAQRNVGQALKRVQMKDRNRVVVAIGHIQRAVRAHHCVRVTSAVGGDAVCHLPHEQPRLEHAGKARLKRLAYVNDVDRR